jgi:hypothetical protein
MEGFGFVTTVTGLNRPNTGKKEDDIMIINKIVHFKFINIRGIFN